MRRWSEGLGRSVVARRDAEVRAYRAGRGPPGPPNAVPLLVIGMDGGRYQGREKDPDTGSRWREEKVLTVSSYLPGDGKDPADGGRARRSWSRRTWRRRGRPRRSGRWRGWRPSGAGCGRPGQVIALGDGGNWIDPLLAAYFHVLARIIDWFHASEHLWDCAKAVVRRGHGRGGAVGRAPGGAAVGRAGATGDRRNCRPGRGQLGPPGRPTRPATRAGCWPTTSRTSRRTRDHMNYPEYRRRGWPIGSGETEAAVKQFNKRVKGTEQFWSTDGVEAILGLRGLWLSQDDRWSRYWENRPAYVN